MRRGLADVASPDKPLWAMARHGASFPPFRGVRSMPKVTAYILSYNQAEKLEAAVSTVLWADEVLVVDSFSTDGTRALAEELGARVVDVPFFVFGDLRNRALEHCTHVWIFSIDSDERCTKSVRVEVFSIVNGTPEHDVWLVPRRSYMMGRWISGSGWYPNFRQPQLFRKGAMRYTLDPVHEGYENLSGKPLGVLQNAIWQYPFRNLAEVIEKMNRYSSLGAPKLAGKRVTMASALGHGLWSFMKHFIFKRGFLDGCAGFGGARGGGGGAGGRGAGRGGGARGGQ